MSTRPARQQAKTGLRDNIGKIARQHPAGSSGNVQAKHRGAFDRKKHPKVGARHRCGETRIRLACARQWSVERGTARRSAHGVCRPVALEAPGCPRGVPRGPTRKRRTARLWGSVLTRLVQPPVPWPRPRRSLPVSSWSACDVSRDVVILVRSHRRAGCMLGARHTGPDTDPAAPNMLIIASDSDRLVSGAWHPAIAHTPAHGPGPLARCELRQSPGRASNAGLADLICCRAANSAGQFAGLAWSRSGFAPCWPNCRLFSPSSTRSLPSGLLPAEHWGSQLPWEARSGPACRQANRATWARAHAPDLGTPGEGRSGPCVCCPSVPLVVLSGRPGPRCPRLSSSRQAGRDHAN